MEKAKFKIIFLIKGILKIILFIPIIILLLPFALIEILFLVGGGDEDNKIRDLFDYLDNNFISKIF